MTDLANFEDQIRALGGSIRSCVPSKLPTLPKVANALNCGCNERASATLPYEGSKSPAFVCANCDCADEFPRVKQGG